MAVDTATIRVTRATRDTLAEQAHERGVSLASLLAEIARKREAELIWRSEREASRLDAEIGEAAIENEEWEVTLADGLE